MSQAQSHRATYGVALGLLVVAAISLLASSGKSWTSAGSSGTEVAGLLTSLPLVAGAGIAGLVATRDRQRTLVGLILVGAAVFGLLDWFVGLGNDGVQTASGSLVWPWPAVALVGAAALIVSGSLTLRFGEQWPVLASRYERAPEDDVQTSDGQTSQSQTSRKQWDALDNGQDPTL